MLSRPFCTIAAGAIAVSTVLGSALGGALALPASRGFEAASAATEIQYRRHHHHGGYKINRYGYGNYVPGRNGSFGGYPAGSAGAQELQNEQRYKCEATPETC